MQQTLPKSNILRGYQQFSNVISTGVCVSERLLSCYVRVKEAGEGEKRNTILIGFSVPKKRIPLAVHRNKLKRLIREAVRKNFRNLKFSSKQYNAQIVVLFKGNANQDAEHFPVETIEVEWKKLQQRIQAMI